MKQTKMMILLAVLFSTYSFATCTKQEVIKLIGKGFNKTEINSICDIQVKSKWITPAKSTCRSYGGKVDSDDRCEAKWFDAKAICSVSGGRLPNIEELKAVVSGCGGTNTKYGDSDWSTKVDRNNDNNNYQKCYKEKGFASSSYRSSTTYANNSSLAWGINFNDGDQSNYGKSLSYYVQCVRAGQ